MLAQNCTPDTVAQTLTFGAQALWAGHSCPALNSEPSFSNQNIFRPRRQYQLNTMCELSESEA
jgi:hypothetical protein